MTRPHALDDLPFPSEDELDDATRRYFEICREKLGLVPNVLRSYSFEKAKLDAFSALYNEVMLAESGLTKLEREMIAVVVSAHNRCFYCLVAHGAAVRELSGDPILGERLVFDYKTANLSPRQRALLDVAWRLTAQPSAIDEAERDRLRGAGLTDRDLFDFANVVGFFNMSNRVAAFVAMEPNEEYHRLGRGG